MNGIEYVIAGDTEEYKDCLVCLAGHSRKHAEQVLEQMLKNPTEQDKRIMAGHSNLRIEEVRSADAWWNDPFLAN